MSVYLAMPPERVTSADSAQVLIQIMHRALNGFLSAS